MELFFKKNLINYGMKLYIDSGNLKFKDFISNNEDLFVLKKV